jgi:beta-lactamase regulating signal transducer with metallopeptidase domain
MKMTAVLLLALGAIALLRHRSAALRHWVLATAIACAALMPMLEIVVPAWPLPLGAPGELRPRPAVAVAAARGDPTASAQPLVDQIEVSTAVPRPLTNVLALDARRWLQPIWLAGAFLSLLVLLTGLGRLTWLAARSRRIVDGRWSELTRAIAAEYGMPRPFVLLQSDHPSLLVTWGLALPKIILPAAASEWSDERARVVLSHELAHIRRGDWMVQLAAELMRSVYWFNPLLWIVCRRLRLESEHACDDEVMNLGVEGADYATHLLALARALNQNRHTWYPAPAMARQSSLERRVRAMLNRRLNRQPLTGTTRAAIVALLLAVTAAIAAAQNMFQTISGTVVDPTGKPVPGVTLVLTNPQRDGKHEVKTNDAGAFEFVGLRSGNYTLEARAAGFMLLKDTVTLAGKSVDRRLALRLGQLEETLTIAVNSDASAEPVIREGPAPDLSGCVASSTGGRIIQPRKIRHVSPAYPAQLVGTGTQGTVVMSARIGLDGFINDIALVGDPQPDLANAAMAAVREWRFSQTLLNCAPVEVTMRVTANFKAMP